MMRDSTKRRNRLEANSDFHRNGHICQLRMCQSAIRGLAGTPRAAAALTLFEAGICSGVMFAVFHWR
jgi:hypothetical protein